jgi:MEDS: MEthanogen/methylotroph, DcmR Sensory domain
MALPLGGQPGHGRTASLRRQPVRIVDGRIKDGYTGVFEPAATQVPLDETGGYRHEAFLYSGMAEFLTGTSSFIRRAVEAGDPILVVVSGSKIDMLRGELGAEAQDVSFADMAEVGANPGRIIAIWRAFADAHAGAPQLWGIGEPAYSGRSPAELAECQLHEALLNVTFDASTPFWLRCPYG